MLVSGLNPLWGHHVGECFEPIAETVQSKQIVTRYL